MATEIDELTEYTGVVPNKDSQTQPVFDGAADTWITWNYGTFVPEMNTFVTQVNTVAAEVQAAADSAINASNWIGNWEDATGAAVLNTTYSYDNNFTYLLKVNLADITASEPSPTNTDWQLLAEPKIFSYVVSQYANGVADDVGYIVVGSDVTDYEYMIWPDDGRVYEVGTVTGIITSSFDPSDGSDAGLSGALYQRESFDSRTLGNSATLDTATAAEITAGTEQKVVTADELAGSEFGFGVGYSWQDVIGSRVSGATNTNSTGKPIGVLLSVTGIWDVSVDSEPINTNQSTTSRGTPYFVVPNGSSYIVTSTGISSWAEFSI